MKILIVGLGKIGYAIAQQLEGENHDLTLVDASVEALNRAGMYGVDNGKNWFGFQTAAGGKASECIQCFQCEAACPQHIEIVGKLQRAAELFE